MCSECNKKFANELDVQNHMTRVHEYGEQFALYPCEDCGFRATDLMEIRHHIESEHKKDNSLQSLGISQLPVVSKRRKHQFNELEIDEDGNINFEEEDEEYDEHTDELLLVDDDDEGWEETTKSNRPKRKAPADKYLIDGPKKKVKTCELFTSIYKER